MGKYILKAGEPLLQKSAFMQILLLCWTNQENQQMEAHPLSHGIAHNRYSLAGALEVVQQAGFAARSTSIRHPGRDCRASKVLKIYKLKTGSNSNSSTSTVFCGKIEETKSWIYDRKA